MRQTRGRLDSRIWDRPKKKLCNQLFSVLPCRSGQIRFSLLLAAREKAEADFQTRRRSSSRNEMHLQNKAPPGTAQIPFGKVQPGSYVGVDQQIVILRSERNTREVTIDGNVTDYQASTKYCQSCSKMHFRHQSVCNE